jgi:hypothetical protein
MPERSRTDSGFYHLTPTGWIRKDTGAAPQGRVETWHYFMEQSSPDAKEQVHLTRRWIAPGMSEADCEKLHKQFGEAIEPSDDREIILNCSEPL